MKNGVIKTYKQDRKIICYIKHYNGVFTTCTGKPSDAEFTANEYFNNRIRTLF